MRSVIFYLRSPEATTSLIMMRVYDRQFADGKFTYSTHEYISPKNWSLLPPPKNSKRKKPLKNGAGQPKRGVIGNDALAFRLTQIEQRLTNYMLTNKESDQFNSQSLRDFLDGKIAKEKKRVVMLDEWDKFLQLHKPQVAKVSYKDYERARETMKKFLTKEGKSNITPSEFDKAVFKQYMSFLHESYPSTNTIAKKLKQFKMFVKFSDFKWGIRPSDIKYRETAGVKISLTEEELEKMENLKLVGHLHNVRVLFLVQCNVGCRISDLFTLDKHISSDGLRFEFIQKKTHKYTSVPITPLVRQYLEEYKYSLPFMAEQTFNESLKQVFKLVSPDRTIQIIDGGKLKTDYVWKHISSHDAIRTFVSISSERGMAAPDIALVIGKSLNVLLRSYLVTSSKRAQEQMLEKWTKLKAVS